MFQVRNERLNERLTFATEEALYAHLLERFRTRGHWLLSYDEVHFRAGGIEYVYRGDYLLLHAIAHVPLPSNPFQPRAALEAVQSVARQGT